MRHIRVSYVWLESRHAECNDILLMTRCDEGEEMRREQGKGGLVSLLIASSNGIETLKRVMTLHFYLYYVLFSFHLFHYDLRLSFPFIYFIMIYNGLSLKFHFIPLIVLK